MDDHLCAFICYQSMPALLKLFAQFPKVLNLAVEDEPQCPILIAQGRASAGCKIDDGEAPLSKANVWRRVYTFVIRTAVHYSFAHGPDGARFRNIIFKYQFSADTAHGSPAHPKRCVDFSVSILII
jgi:hypothetical protein